MHQLLDRDGMLTVGTEERDIDWEGMWRAQLALDDDDPARNGVGPPPFSGPYHTFQEARAAVLQRRES